jgi:FkbM family methyltransferase
MKSLTKMLLGPVLLKARQSADKKVSASVSLLPFNEGITLIDIGAAGDIVPRWKAIELHLNYVGFEPDERSRLLLLEKKQCAREYKLFPFAVAEKSGSIRLNLCRKPMVSSTYLPNQDFTNFFPDPQRFDVLQAEQIEAKALDELEIKADFIKLDIQGGELNALVGGISTLKNTLGLELEVEFLPLYQKQPLFGEMVDFLSNQGFEFIDFISIIRWERKAHNSFGQCVFGDALFLKTPERLFAESPTKEGISSYLGILLLYKRFDLKHLGIQLNLLRNLTIWREK